MASSNSIPQTMRGVIIEKNGGTDVLQWRTDLPVPQPKEGEVLVKNEIVGVNYIDNYFRTGLYPVPSFPFILGREAAGTIVATGSGQVHNLSPGDRVGYLSPATYAEYTAAPALHVAKLPDGISNEIAVAALLQGITALTLVRESYEVKKGDWVLVHAAAGGVGLLLCQLLRAIGAKAIGTVSTPAKAELAKQNGAVEVVQYGGEKGLEEVERRVLEITNGKGVACVLDGVGKATFETSLKCVARKGSLISFGNASGAVEPVTIARLGAKAIRLMRPTMFAYLVEREEFERYVNELFGFIGRGELQFQIHDTYPLQDVARAHNDIESRKTTGKLLLKL